MTESESGTQGSGEEAPRRPSGIERRRFPRMVVPVRECAITADGGDRHTAEILDLSEGGLRFRDARDETMLDSGDTVTVGFSFGDGRALTLRGQIMWTSPYDVSRYEGGVRFDTPSEDIRTYLDTLK